MKENNIATTVATTVPHARKGNSLYIGNITGNIEIVGQPKRTDIITVDITADDTTHDKVVVQVAKGKVSVASRSLVSADLKISIPSGISVRLKNVGGCITINETVEALAVVTGHACKIFTQTLHGMVLRISQDADVNIQNLLGHCDIVADGNAKVTARDAVISTLSVNLADTAFVELCGSARFAKVSLKGWANLRVNRVDEVISKKTEKFSTIDLGWSNRQPKKNLSKADKKQHDKLIDQARKEIMDFIKEFLDVAPPTFKEA